jgi:pyruvate/2-oxoglutarate dehydrogenase complex dihydrolipoamide dehydrogenase (E3) component
MDSDLLVIGGGAAGIGAARAARRRNATVTLIQDGPIGGDCTFTGCIPSKTILAEAARGATFTDAMDRVHRVVQTVAATESAAVLEAEGINVLLAHARFLDPDTLDVDGRRIRASSVVIATGAGPAVPPIPGIDTVPYFTNDSLFDLTELPESLVILGAGPIGVEMAEAFGQLGSVVTLVEATARVLPREEPAASQIITAALAGLGVSVRTGSPATKVSRSPEGRVRLDLADGSAVTAEALLVAVGRHPSSSGLGLEAAGVACGPGGFITVDSRLRTSVKHIFAAGDVAESHQFTHVADQTGRIAAGNALSRVPYRRFDRRLVPWVTFCTPEVARVGMTESEAARHGGSVAFLPLNEVDRAVATGQTEGFVKLIAGPRRVTRGRAGGRVLGATIVAPRAGEMLQEIVLAMRIGMFPARLALTVHPYPTWSTAVQQAAAQWFGEFGGRRARPAREGYSPDARASLYASGRRSGGGTGVVASRSKEQI